MIDKEIELEKINIISKRTSDIFNTHNASNNTVANVLANLINMLTDTYKNKTEAYKVVELIYKTSMKYISNR